MLGLHSRAHFNYKGRNKMLTFLKFKMVAISLDLTKYLATK